MPFKAFSHARFRQKLRHERDEPLDYGNASSSSVAHESMAPDMAIPGLSSGIGKLEPGSFEASKTSSSLFVSEALPEVPSADFRATVTTKGTSKHS
jgi:hypothetical protein